MTRLSLLLPSIFCLLLAQAAAAQIDAVAQAKHDLNLALTAPGKVEKMPVKAGDHVEAGDVLIELEDKEGKAMVELARLAAESDVAVRAGQRQLELAQLEAQRLKSLLEKNAAAPFEYEKARINLALAELQVERAQLEHQQAQQELAQARGRHERFILRAPIDGLVEDIVVDVGESVDELRPVLRMVVTDPLSVDAFVPTGDTLELEVGHPAWIVAKLPGYDAPIEGRITHLAQAADPASETRRVRIEAPNTLDMPSGVHVTVYFDQQKLTNRVSRSD